MLGGFSIGHSNIITTDYLCRWGCLFFYWILGQLGSNALAIGNVIIAIMLVAILPGVGLGQTAMTLVSESLGQNTPKEAFLWPLNVLRIGSLIIGSFSIIILLYPNVALRPFISDPTLINMAITPIRLGAIAVFFELGAIIYMHALNGADQTSIVAWISSFLHWLLYLPWLIILVSI